jgi:hypothetical protein
VPEALRNAGRDVHHHDDRFPENAKDADWLPVVATAGWIIITRDKAIWRNRLQRQAFYAAGARVFIVTAKTLRGQDEGSLIVSKLERMEAIASATPAAFMARVNRTEVVLYEEHDFIPILSR